MTSCFKFASASKVIDSIAKPSLGRNCHCDMCYTASSDDRSDASYNTRSRYFCAPRLLLKIFASLITSWTAVTRSPNNCGAKEAIRGAARPRFNHSILQCRQSPLIKPPNFYPATTTAPVLKPPIPFDRARRGLLNCIFSIYYVIFFQILGPCAT